MTQPVQGHSFFSGEALLDENNNGQVDAEDKPVANATFIVTLQDGTGFGGQTDDTGKAFVTIPASVDYPVTVHMEAPEGSALEIIEPSSFTVSEASGTITFLFSSK